nr:retrotransposon protein, putative, Ty1-copia subclass [Tanacetum cinerariifolium]
MSSNQVLKSLLKTSTLGEIVSLKMSNKNVVSLRILSVKVIIKYNIWYQSHVYYVEGLNHNLFSIGQFCDADLEVAFRKSTCYIHDLKGNDLLTCSRGTDLYSITPCPNLICLMAKTTSSQAWLWHHRLSHLNFDTITLLSKNDIVVGLPKLKFVKDHLCSSIQINQSACGIFINQAKYAQEILIKHGMTSCDSVGTPMATKHLDAYLSGTPIDQTKYCSMVGALMYLTACRPDIMHATCYCARYQAKPKAEYVSLSACCAQVLWMKTQLTDYGFYFDKIPITEYQLADLFTKALPEERFKYLVRRLGMRCLTPDELEILAIESA